ncbi:MAG: thioredoxin domain-containing protein [Candidatus Peribacteraceae bacterium]|nr:thioredoxin domain-containing protein [Candidatus Peribacteraceae bacterium]
MKKIFPLLAIAILVSACVPLPQTQTPKGGSSASSVSLASSVSSITPIELPVEIEEISSSSAASGTGALATRLTDDGFLLIGDAPDHVLTVFTNYGCDYCREFSREMLPRVLEEFVVPGKLSVQIAIVPLKKYPNSALEASALLCAAAEGKGLLMHEELTETAVRDRKSLTAIAKKLALPAQTFAKCLDSKETKASLAGQQALITEQGVTLIPQFLLGTEKKTGLPSYADLRGWIREQLAE